MVMMVDTPAPATPLAVATGLLAAVAAGDPKRRLAAAARTALRSDVGQVRALGLATGAPRVPLPRDAEDRDRDVVGRAGR